MKNKVQLITYVDRFGNGRFDDLTRLLTHELEGLFGTVHVLPFFWPINGADAGFDPIDHRRVDPSLGDWASVSRLGEQVDIAADLIVNHMSADSPQFKDYLQAGEQSEFASMFLDLETAFDGGVTDEDLGRVYRPRPTPVFSTYTMADATDRRFWTTFTNKQIDVDVRQESTRDYLREILNKLADAGVTLVRLDAVGYAVKTRGTSCFMTSETYEFMAELADWCRTLGMQVLAETHTHYARQIRTAKHVDWVYDFALPPLLLHSLFTSDSTALKHWFDICPDNVISVLDTHDGIGVMDVGPDAQDAESQGLLAPVHIDSMVETIHRNTNGQSKRASAAGVRNLDLYQVNSTYYSALGCNDDDYLLARLVQFFARGVPQVYYVGLMAGANDVALFEERTNGRDINRAYFSEDSIRSNLARPVVRTLLSLIRFRNTHPAFGGSFESQPCGDTEIRIHRQLGEDWASLYVDFHDRQFCVDYSGCPEPITDFSRF